MQIELPETFSLPVRQKDGKVHVPEPMPLGFTGSITIPDKWTLGDYEGLYKATFVEAAKLNQWERRWRWAFKHIKEWAIEGLSTNPNEIDEDEMTWILMSFLASSTINAMNDYTQDEDAILEAKAHITFPTPENLRPSEFMTWHKNQELWNGAKGNNKSDLFKSWHVGSPLVRSWNNGTNPSDWEKVDVRVAFAIDELLSETMIPAINLGNWSARPGGV